MQDTPGTLIFWVFFLGLALIALAPSIRQIVRAIRSRRRADETNFAMDLVEVDPFDEHWRTTPRDES